MKKIYFFSFFFLFLFNPLVFSSYCTNDNPLNPKDLKLIDSPKERSQILKELNQITEEARKDKKEMMIKLEN